MRPLPMRVPSLRLAVACAGLWLVAPQVAFARHKPEPAKAADADGAASGARRDDKGDAGKKPSYAKGVVKSSAKTGGGAVRDGARTVGRTIGTFFKSGPKAAKETWKENAATTKENARANGRATRAAASQ